MEATPVFFKWLLGIGIGLLGYLTPVSDVITVVIIAIVLDLITGLWAAFETGKGWKSLKLWRTIKKILLAISVIWLLYAMDEEMGFNAIQIHKFVAFVICGFEVWSILENAAKISNHPIFRILKKYMQDKIHYKTGVDIENYKKTENDENI